MIFKAIEFATKAHTGQFRKGTKVPYIIHPLNVAKILIDLDCSDTIVMAGILHDTIEDTPVTLADIKANFGQEVAGLVQALSEPDRSDTWENRKQHTIDFLKTAPLEVLLVSCADKLDNIRSIGQDYARLGEALWSRFNRPKAKQKWYYEALADVFVSRAEGEAEASLSRRFHSEVNRVFGDTVNPAP